MKTEIDPKHFATVCAALIESDCKTATKYISEKLVVRATWRNKPRKISRHEEIVVTFGGPNYRAVRFVKHCKKAGEPFPVKKVQFTPWPKKKV